ncbi:MAG: N-6 DNA methylase, partial [Pyrinomonadaceae bacterium]
MMDSLLAYQQQIARALAAGNATEHTHRPALKAMIEALAAGVVATNEPKRIKCGAPDFIVTRGPVPLGYVEAKDVGKSLDEVEEGEQLKRYRASLGNLVLTDYLEFRWYVGGERRLTARLASADAKDKLKVEEDGAEQVTQLLRAFLAAEVTTVASPKELAVRMAGIARLIDDLIRRALAEESADGPLHEQMKGFREVLLHDLTTEQFADMYAQTICYGLFAARCNARGGTRFTRQHAAYDLPNTNPFLKKLFTRVAGPELDDEPHAWAVDDLAELLHRADIGAILADFGKRTRREDPVVHFYETFLAAYDPRLRETRGVYYTPEPVVSYIVRSVNHILKTDFNLPEGLADTSRVTLKGPSGEGRTEVHKVLILDPAVGTGTFLHGIVRHIHESLSGQRGMWPAYVSAHLLPRLFGFELLMAPYAVAHMKLGLQLSETGYDFRADERLRVYLTNTLEEAFQLEGVDPFGRWIAEEASAANEVKQEAPVMVVLGNPPYSGHSANMGQWIAKLLRGVDTQTGKKTGNYFEVGGQPLGERNPKWLNDDYVKFIRFAQWRIEQTGYGVLAFVTNHGYLDNPTFRGMRQSLIETFDDIYVLDLHGNSKKKERAPDSSKDQNVFDIQQGVAIGIFVKRAGTRNAGGGGQR